MKEVFNRQYKLVFYRYLIATAGLFLVALGVALSILSNLGTSPLSCPAYVMEGIWGLTVGNWTILINMSYLVIQLIILRKRFKKKYLMQIAATFVFGYMIDLCILCCQWIHPGGIAGRIALILLACAVTAMGVSIEVIARAWMLSAEMTVFAVTQTAHFKFNTVKVAMDSMLVVISGVLAWLIHGNPFGFGKYENLAGILLGKTEGVVIGLGTLLMALLCGGLMKFTDPLANKLLGTTISKMTFSGSPEKDA